MTDLQNARPAHETATFRIEAITPEHLNQVRASGLDSFGNPLVPTTDVAGGSPLRCCLRPAQPGEQITVISYRPFTRPGPFAESGPVFIHADACPGYTTPQAYPAAYADRPTMIFRPYRYDGVIAYDAIQMGDSSTAHALIAGMFADPSIEFIHVRNVHAGCFMFAVTRPPAAPAA